MASSLAASTQEEEGWDEPSRVPLQRTTEQERARIQRAKLTRQGKGLYIRRGPSVPNNRAVPRAANDDEQDVAENAAAQRVNRLRFFRAQTILASEEEGHLRKDEAEHQKPSLVRYMPAFSAATLKDALDFIGIGSLPVIGTIVTFIFSIIIFALVIFAKKNGSIQDMRFVIRRALVVLVGFFIEAFLFGVNFFPFEIATVAVIYFMDKHLSTQQIAFLQNITHRLRGSRL